MRDRPVYDPFMKIRRLATSLFLASLLIGCSKDPLVGDFEVQLTNGFRVVRFDVDDVEVICFEPVVRECVPAKVVEIGWNSNFIAARQQKLRDRNNFPGDKLPVPVPGEFAYWIVDESNANYCVYCAIAILCAGTTASAWVSKPQVRVSAWYWLNSAPKADWQGDFTTMKNLGFTDVLLCWGLDLSGIVTRKSETKQAMQFPQKFMWDRPEIQTDLGTYFRGLNQK